MRLSVLPDILSICQLPAGARLPSAVSAGFFSITYTADEISVICSSGSEPAGARLSTGWRAIAVEGPLDFSLTGILASIASPLSDAGVSIFAISTFDTDYILVRDDRLSSARTALLAAGHTFVDDGATAE